MQKTIKIITEGGQNFGFGHVVRCKALCDAFIELGHNAELIIQGDESILSILDLHYTFVDWHTNLNYLTTLCQYSDICIIDSYVATIQFYNTINEATNIFAFFDDTNRLEYTSGILLNGSFNALEKQYLKLNIKKLLGINYQCVRKEFWNQMPKVINKIITSVVITVGGNDIRNLIPQLLVEVQKTYQNSKIAIIIGATSPNIATIKKVKDSNISIHINATVEKIIQLMQEADFAISASGQTLCELACCGLPAISVSVVDNQLEHAKKWHNEGCIDFAGSWDENNFWYEIVVLLKKQISVTYRQERSLKMQSIIDGKGAIRVATFLLEQ